MNGTTLERPDMAAYLDAVRSQLSDLPTEERDDLVADVEASLLESGEAPKLSPHDFAAELREAAGLSPAASATPVSSPLDSLRTWLTSERVASLRTTARELTPMWWLVRAYVAVAVVALAVGWGWPVGWGTSGNSISFAESVIALLAAAAVSIWLGLRGRAHGLGRARLRLGINLAIAVATIPVAVYSVAQLESRTYVSYVTVEPVPGLANSGHQIRNLYPYSRDGRLLQDVLLYDDRGLPVPIMIGFDDPLRRVLEGIDGRPLRNSYPIRYYEPGTTTVAQPTLGPPVEVPEIVTPPLELGSR